jgi:phage terminase large subunit
MKAPAVNTKSVPDKLLQKVQFPRALDGALFGPERYHIFEGGRGSAKSWSVARAFVLMAATGYERIL